MAGSTALRLSPDPRKAHEVQGRSWGVADGVRQGGRIASVMPFQRDGYTGQRADSCLGSGRSPANDTACASAVFKASGCFSA